MVSYDGAFQNVFSADFLCWMSTDSKWSFKALGRIRAAVDEHGDGPRTKWKFLGRDVCVSAWKKLHGLGCLTYDLMPKNAGQVVANQLRSLYIFLIFNPSWWWLCDLGPGLDIPLPGFQWIIRFCTLVIISNWSHSLQSLSDCQTAYLRKRKFRNMVGGVSGIYWREPCSKAILVRIFCSCFQEYKPEILE